MSNDNPQLVRPPIGLLTLTTVSVVTQVASLFSTQEWPSLIDYVSLGFSVATLICFPVWIPRAYSVDKRAGIVLSLIWLYTLIAWIGLVVSLVFILQDPTANTLTPSSPVAFYWSLIHLIGCILLAWVVTYSQLRSQRAPLEKALEENV